MKLLIYIFLRQRRVIIILALFQYFYHDITKLSVKFLLGNERWLASYLALAGIQLERKKLILT